MNIYKVLNKITKYIDDHLDSKIDYEVLSKMMGVNSYTMQRIFSLLTNITLADYIRKRRLSNAGIDLYKYRLKVMDVAMKYQYNNATSFSRAFLSFHGIKPSQVNSLNKLKIYPRILFDEVSKEVSDIEYQIVETKEMVLYGIGTKTNNKDIKKDAPIFFRNIEEKYKDIYGDIKYGMVTYEDDLRMNCNGYYVLYDKKILEFEKIIIPKSKWLVFRINSQNALDIQKMSTKFYAEVFPDCKYNLREIPELEYYYDGVTDFMVPIY